ncbi:histidine phosphatase family protein [Inconstantimicrobium porci]|nr:histidine phosphatase family protein [Inconstantimicrobium porci]MDD6772275.1 histidine phosphatase family protein [Inconstantimicrobium porci]
MKIYFVRHGQIDWNITEVDSDVFTSMMQDGTSDVQ